MAYNLYIENGESIPAIKIVADGDSAPVGYTLSSNISIDWDKHSNHIINSDLLTVNEVRDEILSDYNSITWVSGSEDQKSCWSKWFVASQSEIDTKHSSDKQKDNAEMLSEKFLKDKKKIDKSSIVEAIQSSTSIPVFAPYLAEASYEKEVSTKESGSYQTILTLTTDSVASGKYKIGWYFESNGSDKGSIESIVILNDLNTLMDSSVELKDKKNWIPNGGFKYETITEGVHIIQIKLKTDSKDTVSIRRVRLDIMKIS